MNVFGQGGYDIRLEWSAEGVTALGDECPVLVVVDVLSFSTTVDLALMRGGWILPMRWGDPDASEAARRAGAMLPDEHGWSLRPFSVLSTPPGMLIALPSPNGATLCTLAAGTEARVLTACLRNARAVAEVALALAKGSPVGVVPSGERWGFGVGAPPDSVGSLRPCVEDHLGAGAVVDALIAAGARWPSPEASMAARAYRAAGPDLGAVVAGSSSGAELREAGRGGDVDLAVAVNRSSVAPLLVEGVFQDAVRRQVR